ncbi:MAG: hypothetical protein WA609_13350, partial [Terriglobales bacterium]
ASLGMAAAVANYDTYLRSEYSWMLGRFIVPVARLGEFEDALGQMPAKKTESSWSVSALPSAELASELARIREFNDRFAASTSPKKVRIESIEVRIASAEEIDRLTRLIPAGFETYFEILSTGGAASSEMRDCIAAVASSGRRAKIRTGGETPDKFPAPEHIAEFIRLCAASDVAFKATAGLHHPGRSLHRLTYQADSPSGIMHGFLNVFLAASFVRSGMDTRLAVELLNEQSASSFHFDSEGVLWREHRLGLDDICAARRNFAISFGSCSFTEPVEDLRTLDVL